MWARRLPVFDLGCVPDLTTLHIRKATPHRMLAIPMTSRQFTNEYTDRLACKPVFDLTLLAGQWASRKQTDQTEHGTGHERVLELTQSGGSEQDGLVRRVDQDLADAATATVTGMSTTSNS